MMWFGPGLALRALGGPTSRESRLLISAPQPWQLPYIPEVEPCSAVSSGAVRAQASSDDARLGLAQEHSPWEPWRRVF